MSWVWDAPTGVFKNHALSSDLRIEAIADTQFMRFLRNEPGYGRQKGESVTITRIRQLPLATRVSEIDRLPDGRPAIETKSVTISEWGFKIPMTQVEMNRMHFNPTDPFRQTLRNQISLTGDKMAADAFKATPYKYTPTSSGGTFSTTGTAGATADRNFGVQDLRRIHDKLRTLKCPKYRNGKYVGILSTQAARGIKNDPDYKDWLAPSSSEPFISGRLKDVEGFMLIESNHENALEENVGASTTTGEAVFFGADAAGKITIQEPELRAGIPEDLGRFREVGWVGEMEAFLTWETAALSRVIHGTSL